MRICSFLLKAFCSLSPQTHTRLFRSYTHSPKDQTYQALEQPSWSGNDNHQLLHKLGNEGNLGALGSLVGLWRAEHHIMVLAVNSSFLCQMLSAEQSPAQQLQFSRKGTTEPGQAMISARSRTPSHI